MATKNTLSQMEGTSTDLLFEYFADPSKLKPDEKELNIPNRIDERTEDSDLRSRSSYSRSSSKKSSTSSKSSKRDTPVAPKPSFTTFQPHNIPPVTNVQPTVLPMPQDAQPNRFPSTYVPSYNPMDERTIKFKKMELLAKLHDIKRSGRTLTREYSINSEIEDMEMEIRYQTEAENKKQGVDLAKNFLCYSINVLEYVNEKFDPFGLQLKGWSDRIKMNIDNYNDVMGELYEKYKGSGRKVEPEIKLLFMIMFSAATVHTSKAITKSIGLEDAVKNNPELLQKLQGNLTGAFENKIGRAPPPPPQQDPIAVQREMYKKMMEEKAKEAATAMKKPQVSSILDKLKNKIPLNVDTSKLEETSVSDTPRIKVTKTLDTETESISEANMTKIRRKRPVLRKN